MKSACARSHQPAGQCRQVHHAGQRDAAGALCAPDGHAARDRHRPRHGTGRAGAHLRALARGSSAGARAAPAWA
jgi:hypothetical protein